MTKKQLGDVLARLTRLEQAVFGNEADKAEKKRVGKGLQAQPVVFACF